MRFKYVERIWVKITVLNIVSEQVYLQFFNRLEMLEVKPFLDYLLDTLSINKNWLIDFAEFIMNIYF